MTTVKHYITKEIELITQFCHLLEKDEYKSKLSTKINKAVEHYLKVINAIDVPRTRHIHTVPTPKLGGLAIFLGFCWYFLPTVSLFIK